MAVTLGFVFRMDQVPASMMPPVQVVAPQPVIDVRPINATVQPLRHTPNSQWQRNSAGQFLNQPATYNVRGQNRTEDQQGSHLDLFV